MKTKNVILIAIIAAILVIIVLVSEKPFQDKAGQKTPDRLEAPKKVSLFQKIKADDCYQIQIFQMDGMSSSTLKKLDGVWYTNPERKYPAAKKNVERIFETLGNSGEGEVVSKNPENHIKFQVDKLTGTRVKFFDKSNASIGDYYIGKMGPNYMNPITYVRAEGSDEVVAIPGMMMGLFQAGEDNWREREIFDIKSEDITGFTLQHPNQPPIKLGRLASDEWTCLSPKSFQIKKEDGSRIVNSFAHLRASGFIKDYPQKPYEEYGLGTDAFAISCSLKDGSSTPTLYIGHESKEQSNQWFVRAEGQDTVYFVYQYIRDSFMKTLDDLEAKPTPTPAPPQPVDQEALQERARKTAEELNAMSEEEREAAIQKKIDDILKNAVTPAKTPHKEDQPSSSTEERQKEDE
ncbi:MAG TPA: DUF4340 domain-containing protein [Candidatus Sumerlaeota bacterium]|nr:MAG: hypothetical protein BWY12_01607 [candidate division BRC1 bacterium ADurb.Bin183]HOE64637.1 DUF4340 domain-containing protein [Candidatus Sumerlaeota bacterium]HRR32024.1 DUF4340 domain-containing protein [Candidatus Sumerlaeia bacterium]HON51002.1 DUF4340 domain-containing protein [Candidatus Sumerlaeota bacterium]HOR63758.1 DUF4340 domain-containing protein [Candidatus Sumerlaeota bacterium]